MQTVQNFWLRTTVLFTSMAMAAACNKAGDSQANPPPAKEAKAVIETVESDLNNLSHLTLCKVSVQEKPIGTELKDYDVAIACPDPDSLERLDKRVADMQKIVQFISDYHSNMLNATLSQIRLLDQYKTALEHNISALKSMRKLIVTSESDSAYQNELARLKAAGCQPQSKEYSYEVVCEKRMTLADLAAQAAELKAVQELLNSQLQRMRLADKYNQVIGAYDSALSENKSRVGEVQVGIIAGFANLAADLKARFQVELQVQKWWHDYTSDFSHPEQFSLWDREKYVQLALGLKDFLSGSEAASIFAEREIKILRLNVSDSSCGSDESQGMVYKCPDASLEYALKAYPTKADHAELAALTEKLQKSPSLRTLRADSLKFSCQKDVPSLACLKVARWVDQIITKNPKLTKSVSVVVKNTISYSRYDLEYGEGSAGGQTFYVLTVSASDYDTSIQSFLTEHIN